ncbi:MAG: hypothetical protein EAZ70_03450 [Runella slithyformis]|nr:MAG: hypothetical protein EAY79_03160 [Runella slithyformis]TAF28985.1 MAG: hypothetical protein EAZ70_03450 [Runella slithyformis]TAF46444.1 MAG: hypothetical protein EAZ63_09370 [Runella slithyformis]TAF82611.1 MAG: hypothetical protein EAZ50_03700 [Runella slithyformis]TAH07772.1 MAG: hypothetical protein EAZ14_10730 [Runella slithyformis]
MKSKSLIAVIVPIYKAELTAAEEISLRQCLTVLHQYPIFIAKPQSLNIDFWLQAHPQLRIHCFDDHHFASTNTYNKLMASPKFYESFVEFEYVLIHQLDAFVFEDKLTEWCNKKWDYVGAPYLKSKHWQATEPFFYSNYENRLSRILLNGGLSLRNVRACLRFLKVYNCFFETWKGNEDMLFSLSASRLFWLRPWLKLPSYQEALSFAFEREPQRCFELNNQQLPFGCHAWERYDKAFWEAFIPQNTINQ